MSQKTDIVLVNIIKDCQKSDVKAQEAFYHHFSKLVMSICMRYSANRSDAEDIFQETFIVIFENIKSLQFPEYVVSWIYKIVISKASRYYRKNLELTGGSVNGEELRFEDDIIDQMSAEELLDLIQQLPHGYRIVFNMRILEGYSHREIAEQLNINETTSRSQLFKAKLWLKNRLAKVYGIYKYE